MHLKSTENGGVQLVWSPPDLDRIDARIDARNSAVVVQELFRQAKSSILTQQFNQLLEAGYFAAVAG